MSIESYIKSNNFISKQEKTYVNLIFTGLYFFTHINIFLKDFDLTEPQYNVLRILAGSHPEKLLYSDLQSRMLHRESNATRLINKLIKKKYVERSQSNIDKRQYFHSITEEGLAFLAKIRPDLTKSSNEMFNIAEHKLDELNKLLDEVRDII